jgi:hypothetical protein
LKTECLKNSCTAERLREIRGLINVCNLHKRKIFAEVFIVKFRFSAFWLVCISFLFCVITRISLLFSLYFFIIISKLIY